MMVGRMTDVDGTEVVGIGTSVTTFGVARAERVGMGVSVAKTDILVAVGRDAGLLYNRSAHPVVTTTDNTSRARRTVCLRILVSFHY